MLLSHAPPPRQTVINSLFPVLVPAIGVAGKLTTKPIDVFGGMGGVTNWQQAFPSSCQDPSPWTPCAWFCDAQSCDQCHPNNNVSQSRAPTGPQLTSPC